jgi:hypothetical protein
MTVPSTTTPFSSGSIRLTTVPLSRDHLNVASARVPPRWTSTR